MNHKGPSHLHDELNRLFRKHFDDGHQLQKRAVFGSYSVIFNKRLSIENSIINLKCQSSAAANSHNYFSMHSLAIRVSSAVSKT